MARHTFATKNVSTVFVVRNVTSDRKTIKIFGQKIRWYQTYDLLAIPDISESDIRHSLLKGEIRRKADVGEIIVVDSTIDLYQYDGEQREFLESIGINLVVWDDLRTPLTAIKLAGVKDPAFDVFLGGVRAYSFSSQALAINEEEVFFTTQLPHSYKEGTDIVPHIHWSPSTTDAGTTRWGLEYTWQNAYLSVFPTTTTIYAESVASGVANDHLMANFDPIDGAGKKISSMLICRLFRNSSHDNDDYGAAAFVLEQDFHFQKNTDGSRAMLIKN